VNSPLTLVFTVARPLLIKSLTVPGIPYPFSSDNVPVIVIVSPTWASSTLSNVIVDAFVEVKLFMMSFNSSTLFSRASIAAV